MTRRPSFALGVAAAVWLLSTLAAAAPIPQAAPPQAPARPPEDPAAGLFMRLCNECHDAVPIVSKRRTRADWEDVINKMVEKGLDAGGKDLETVFAYLNRTYGKVYVNTAPADELVAVLTLSQKDADAIVAFRKANGPIADFEALKKVPGIDLKKLEEHADAVAF